MALASAAECWTWGPMWTMSTSTAPPTWYRPKRIPSSIAVPIKEGRREVGCRLGMDLHVETESVKLIKPSTPTPSTLGNYKISGIDEFLVDMNIRMVLFFEVDTDNNPTFVARLEKSLAKTLTRLHPLAGRYIQETQTVDCSDQGAKFIHSKVSLRLQDILDSEYEAKLIDKFIPSTDPAVLATQVTSFEGGGVAVGVTISHKIADASTLCTFLNGWAALSREDNEFEFTGPGFNAPSLFPGRGQSPFSPTSNDKSTNDVDDKVTKRFSFSEGEISNMKAQLMGTRYISKVQLISATIWKALIFADLAIHKHPRDFILVQLLNLRGITASLIPENSCGNIVVPFAAISNKDETTQGLAYLLSDSVREVKNNFSKLRHESEQGQSMVFNPWSMTNQLSSSASLNGAIISSWCKFPFHEADFGFGKPVWVTFGSIQREITTVYLIDGIGGNGVDAYVGIPLNAEPYFTEALHMNNIGT